MFATSVVERLCQEVERLRAENAKLRAYAPQPLDDALPTYAAMVQRLADAEAEVAKVTANAEQLQDGLEKAQQRAHESEWGTRILDERAEQEAERLRAENAKLRAELSLANDLVARLRVKCEERKAVMRAFGQRQYVDPYAWKRAQEDV